MKQKGNTIKVLGKDNQLWVDNQRLSTAIQRVRELHSVSPVNKFGFKACKGCSDLISMALGYEHWVAYELCPTIQALDGEQK